MSSRLESGSTSLLDTSVKRKRVLGSVGNRSRRCLRIALAAALLFAESGEALLFAMDFRGAQFIGFETISDFNTSVTTDPPRCVLISPVIQTAITWDELIPSWNLAAGTCVELKIEAR